MELKATGHSYYCSDSNYYVGNHHGENYGRFDYESWQDFKENWLDEDLQIDHDYNHCFRFDIKKFYDEEAEEEIENRFTLNLYFILQRKGIFRPVRIKEITESDIPEIRQYLQACWEYMQNQWVEFAEQ